MWNWITGIAFVLVIIWELIQIYEVQKSFTNKENNVKKPKGKIIRHIVVLIITLMIGSGVIANKVLPIYIVEVPDVTGIPYENAKIELGNYGLRYSIYDNVNDRLVASQGIKAGTYIRKGTTVKLELEPLEETTTQTLSETTEIQTESELYTEQATSEASTELQSETEENTEETNYFDSFNIKESHTPSDAMNVLRIDYWNVDSDIDVRGLTYEDGFLYTVYNALSVMGGNSADPIDSVLAYIYKPGTSKPSLLTGDIVLHNDSYGTDAYAEFSAWVDGEEVWTSPTTLTGTTIEPISMSIDLSNMEYGFEIHAHCVPNGDGIKFAIVNWVFE